VIVRRSLAAAALTAVALLVATAIAEQPADGALASGAVYRLRADPRMCPSPRCGGFWASAVNRTVTTCLEGTSKPACYVASIDLTALAPSAQASLRAALASGRVLLQGVFARRGSDELPPVAALVARDGWLAVGRGTESGVVYDVADTGVRCVRAPCFSYRATVVNGRRGATLSGVAFGLAKVPASALGRVQAALLHGGVLAAGTVKTESVGKPASLGRALFATQVWLEP
jgi:hypothetical protein